MSGIDTAGYPRDTLSSIVVGLYAWVLAASFGAAVLDVVYAKTIVGIVDSLYLDEEEVPEFQSD